MFIVSSQYKPTVFNYEIEFFFKIFIGLNNVTGSYVKHNTSIATTNIIQTYIMYFKKPTRKNSMT